MKEGYEIVGKIGTAFGLIIYAIITRSITIFLYYTWFLLPMSPNLGRITLTQAIGLAFILSLFRESKLDEQHYLGVKIETKKNWTALIVFPWLIILLGYIVKSIIY